MTMNDSATTRALLPAGLHDLLPPDAEREATLIERAMGVFRSHGYERVKPPLVEFEESLVSGVGRAWARQTFRLLDPESQRMMGVRADMTLQTARIASSRLAKAPRPLRLCYAGEVLRVLGAQLSPERQLRQIGCELIGSLEPAADAEIILLAVHALTALGVGRLSIDLNLPTMVPAIFGAYGITGDDERNLAAALSRRDARTVGAAPGAGALLQALLEVAGPAPAAIDRLRQLDLPAEAEAERTRLIAAIEHIKAQAPDLALTIDPVERQGFEYQTGLSFTIYARGARRELGRGGRYRIGTEPGEPAVGFSLFSEPVVSAAPVSPGRPRVYLPFGLAPDIAERLRADDWITVSGLAPAADERGEAVRLGCGFVIESGATEPVPIG